ncbi:MAG: GTP-binding protein TypA [Sphingobacteriales bacterium 39-40-5]|jgi:GTP-binding protein|uniref:translational GTPase TypA n=1 Tax=Daejeonella sp. TaxID=2805397 RepID=UPI000BC64764|nr:translational GTPase TypA [Daejeonella sp.]OYY04042.1 MAG: GTP-binding protein TypA [Sphingobacteriia bacterium 35-40-5]OZA61265.1 MAG: GTP-binding protein TypA [Sphingobacteriales bacterium 39-40-5]HQT24410.1 translational GTPase TypA [Daejeonella sp.]HQT58989.1 translational GTPase TypA [Daejeonella sp.]
MQKIRNIAIIAHVDHGKTTLVDKILHQTNLFRDNQDTGDLILDSNDLERERGITIVSKNVSVNYKGVKINIIDTPGHADFGGEVERVLKMADGVILLVDAFEGAMPQTRFVTQKALSLGLKPVVIVNKVDKENCRPEEVYESIFELFFNLEATEDQLDFPVLYGSSKQGWMNTDWKVQTEDITPLLDTILEHIPPAPSFDGTLQMQITSLDYSSFVGRIAIGRVARGVIKENQPVSLVKRDGKIQKSRIKELYTFEGLGKIRVQEVSSGDICAVVGIEGFDIGDTIADFENPEQLEVIKIDEPTMNMLFTINNSPMFGKEGKFVTSQRLRERLYKEMEKNLALKVVETDSPDSYLVYGRGILHLSVLIETMRREGYELQVGQPQVIIKEIDGMKCEPIETLIVDVPAEVSGKVIELVTQRKGELLIMEPKGDLQHLEFEIPARGIIGLRNNVLTATAGEAIMAHRFKAYEPWKGNIPGRLNGVLVSMEKGSTTAYSIDKLQDRGRFFIEPGVEVYEGQIMGEHIRDNDLVVNVVKGKALTNMRASGTDDNARIATAVKFSLEEAMEYIQADEYIEITPKSMRLRKIYLTENERKINAKKFVNQ